MDEEIARDGVLKNAKAELVTLAARYRVSPPELKVATAELINTAGKAFPTRLVFCDADCIESISPREHNAHHMNADSISSSYTP